MRFSSIISSAAAVTALMASCVSCVTLAAAQELLELPAVPLYDGAAPGSEDPRYPESAVKSPGGRMFVANVSIPDYTPYLPGPSANTRTAVIIAPGGGFRILDVDSEGHNLARFLAKRGLAAFVLKYRVMQTDPNAPPRPLPVRADGSPPPLPPDMLKAAARAVADAERAIAMIRARAGDYAIDPNRIVFVGFSSGAHVAAYMGLNANPAARANYVAPIYGAPFIEQQPAIPADMPPVFMVWAQDDQLVRPNVRTFYDALLAAGKHPEAHFYMNGGHGFGMTPTGKSSDVWPDAFFNWLRANGLT